MLAECVASPQMHPPSSTQDSQAKVEVAESNDPSGSFRLTSTSSRFVLTFDVSTPSINSNHDRDGDDREGET
jgi:hypothetical protein